MLWSATLVRQSRMPKELIAPFSGINFPAQFLRRRKKYVWPLNDSQNDIKRASKSTQPTTCLAITKSDSYEPEIVTSVLLLHLGLLQKANRSSHNIPCTIITILKLIETHLMVLSLHLLSAPIIIRLFNYSESNPFQNFLW